jgi:hypothetical protein
MASSALVNVADDAEHRLVKLLADSAGGTSVVKPNFIEECDACIANGDASKLLRCVTSESNIMTALVTTLNDNEGISAMSLLGALLDRVKDDGSNVITRLLNDLSDAIINVCKSTETTCKGVTLLATLYNMRSDPTQKVSLLVKMIQLGSSCTPSLLEVSTGNGTSMMLSKLIDPTRLTAMLDEWKIPPSGRRDLYKAAAEAISNQNTKQQFTLLVVETYSKSDVDATGVEYAKKAAIGAIKDPVSLFVQQRKLLSQPAIEALGQNDGTCTKPVCLILKSALVLSPPPPH